MFKRNLIALVFFSMSCFVLPVSSDEATLESGLKAVESEDYMTAYQIFKVLAEQGDAEAQHNLAILYRQGKGVMQDVNQAADLFRKSAEQGLPSSQFYLGHLYDTGSGVEKNPELAVKWYQKAAEQGDPLAQTNLGVAYANGEGVGQDIIMAYVWFSLAASQGLTNALENRNVLKQDMSEELVKNAQRLTREYFARYVAPYQPKGNNFTGGNHPRLPGAHQSQQHSNQQTQQNPASRSSVNPPVDGNHTHKH